MAEQPAVEHPVEHHDLSVKHFLDLFGGAKGVFDSSAPAVVFIVVKLLSDLNTGLIAAVVVGLLILAFRRLRGESVQQSVSGFFGLLLAVVFARSTGSGKGFFLPGIIITAVSGLAFAMSNLLGQPAIAMALVAIDQKYAGWKEYPALRSACVRSTWVWSASFLIRASVASAVALSVGDGVKDNAILFGVIQVEKYLMIFGAALYTVAAVRGVPVRPAPDVP